MLQEVAIRLRFTRECLGNAKRRRGLNYVFCMERGSRKQVIFLPTAWAKLMQYASQVANRHADLVHQVDWHPFVDGQTSHYRRAVTPRSERKQGRACYAVHEAFLPGDVITIHAVLPDGLGCADLFQLLELVGAYRGFSPFRSDVERYGTFEVLSVLPHFRPHPTEETVMP